MSAGTRASPDFIAPIEADCGGNKKRCSPELFRARELGFPCHRTVFSPDFPAPAVYQATRTGQSLLGYGGFGAFLPTCGLTNRWKCRHRAPAFRFSGPLGMIKLTAFRTVGLESVGYLFRRWRPARGGRSVGSSFAERRHDDLLRAIPWPGGSRRRHRRRLRLQPQHLRQQPQ